MKTFFQKLELVAARIDREKGLYFFAAVHPAGGLYDRWDLLVSSPSLSPWSMDATRYIAKLLKESLTVEEIVRIARIVALPRDNKVIASLEGSSQIEEGRVTVVNDGEFDRVFLASSTANKP